MVGSLGEAKWKRWVGGARVIGRVNKGDGTRKGSMTVRLGLGSRMGRAVLVLIVLAPRMSPGRHADITTANSVPTTVCDWP